MANHGLHSPSITRSSPYYNLTTYPFLSLISYQSQHIAVFSSPSVRTVYIIHNTYCSRNVYICNVKQISTQHALKIWINLKQSGYICTKTAGFITSDSHLCKQYTKHSRVKPIQKADNIIQNTTRITQVFRLIFHLSILSVIHHSLEHRWWCTICFTILLAIVIIARVV